ncbi:MAG: hypothetical protein ABI910_22085, partial [Gemmatimonadota bacterium]
RARVRRDGLGVAHDALASDVTAYETKRTSGVLRRRSPRRRQRSDVRRTNVDGEGNGIVARRGGIDGEGNGLVVRGDGID